MVDNATVSRGGDLQLSRVRNVSSLQGTGDVPPSITVQRPTVGQHRERDQQRFRTTEQTKRTKHDKGNGEGGEHVVDKKE